MAAPAGANATLYVIFNKGSLQKSFCRHCSMVSHMVQCLFRLGPPPIFNASVHYNVKILTKNARKLATFKELFCENKVYDKVIHKKALEGGHFG